MAHAAASTYSPAPHVLAVGAAVGVAVGDAVGVAVGMAVGVTVGVKVGVAVGAAVGDAVGVAVGDAVGVVVRDVVFRTDLNKAFEFNSGLNSSPRRALLPPSPGTQSRTSCDPSMNSPVFDVDVGHHRAVVSAIKLFWTVVHASYLKPS